MRSKPPLCNQMSTINLLSLVLITVSLGWLAVLACELCQGPYD